ncbi:LuxR C-terminal-related transcriptional regulator [Amnibacterium sp. CER49]|uniref:helix-turn-helix transcriptional regulator n=1 Tax=Amnibacterium sp. CER49 TaxID=3039161 RepID=UPI002448349D|nr:LuxR C-terminal-related transcriptional regulator [Amnibacterium sp. CER49]MDH2442729.1 LuxR C-terminal-related transcriptional regulator [Amnibacterium sp. CER49]
MHAAPTRFVRVDWRAEVARLRREDADGTLDADGLERLGIALELTGQGADAVPVLDRAAHAHLDAGARDAASRCVFWIGWSLANRGAFAQAAAWAGRLAALAAGEPSDSITAARLLVAEAAMRAADGDLAGAAERSERALAIADRESDGDLLTIAALGCGRSLVGLGQVERGMACMDRVMLAVARGEAGDLAAGAGFCGVIASCMGRGDLERAGEWTGALDAWCRAQEGLVPFRGECLLHRATLLQVHGDWREAQRLVADLRVVQHRIPPGAVRYREAELLRLTGRTTEAEHAYREAAEAGHEVQPGLALLRLAQGAPAVAVSGLRRALAEARVPNERADLLDALVEVALALPDLAVAEAAAGELSALAGGLATAVPHGQAGRARGAVLLAQGQAEAALGPLRSACAAFRAVEAVYETARTRLVLARAMKALGDGDGALAERQAAERDLARIGAESDLERLRRPSTAASGAEGLSPRELEVLRLVASGASNAAIAATLHLSDRTVARHVGNILAKLRLANRAAATAYGYEHGLLERA